MIPSIGTTFDACYILVGRDEEFAIKCMEVLISLNISIVAVIGQNALKLKSHFETSRHLIDISDITFDSAKRPWSNLTTLQAISNKGLLGINGGIEYLLTNEFLEKHCVVNLHPAPLPINRGSHHSFWAIMEDEPMGATLHWITEGLDEGPIIASVRKSIEPSMTAQDVQKNSNRESINLLQSNIMNLMNGEWTMVQQNGRASMHLKRDILPASTIEYDSQYSGDFILRLSRAVCNKNNGFVVKTEHGSYKVVVDSVLSIEEN